MAPKKKKTQLKKVERGYATTSIPKKSLPIEPPPEEATASEEERNKSDAKSDASPLLQDDTVLVQTLVDKYQERTEKETIRNLKTIEYERRMMRSLPQVDVEESLVNEIIDLIGTEESRRNKAQLPVASRENLMGQMGLAYGVLNRLGLSEGTITKCLRETHRFELEYIYDWLFVHSPNEVLDLDKRLVNNAESVLQTTDVSSVPGSPKPSLNAESSSLSDENALMADPSGERGRNAPNGLVSSVNAADYEDPNAEYVRVKLRIQELTGPWRRHDETADNQLLRNLQSRLQDVKKHYFFDKRDAEALYQVKERENQEARLSLQSHNDRAASQSSGEANTENITDIHASLDVTGLSEDSDSSFGAMFDLLKPLQSTETSSTGTIVTVRDMPFPKQWTGRTPKLLLQELILRLDRFAAITYSDISGASRAKRASVRIKWVGGRASEWVMEDVACHDLAQAEHYIATIALHALTYPSTSGFRDSGGNPKGAQTSYKHLSSTFRDLWNELDVKRKENIDKKNREIWASLSAILQERLSNSHETEGRRQKEITSNVAVLSKERITYRCDSEDLRNSFFLCQSSPRYQRMLEQRNALPIASYRQNIIEALDMSQVIVLSGDTGCGKSTQLPSFLLEDQLLKGNHCKIVVTEPRRISALSLAQRVSRELGDLPGAIGTTSSLVGYSIRLENRTSKSTRLNFVTNGIALRMFEEGTGAIDEVTHVIVDEVHERSIDSDFLLIILKSFIQERPDVKVVLMSATIDAEKISNYFGGCPVLRVPGRTYPVDTRFLEDALEYTGWSITEESSYCRKIYDRFRRSKKVEWSEDTARNDDDDEPSALGSPELQNQRYSSSTISTINLLDEKQILYELILCLLQKICDDPALTHLASAFLVFMPGLAEIRRLTDLLAEHPFFGTEAFRVFPLHSTILTENQGLVFELPPPAVRKIVIATNIAETGVTIPDITCVIDSGKHREMRFDEKRKISRLVETFIARSNAAQRRGRAGRVQPGICFHLFSRSRHDSMMDQPLPEMLRLSLSDLALRIKILKINLGSSIEDVLARSLDPPSSINVQRAKAALVEVGALTSSEQITPMGRLLSKLPTDVHLGKFLLIAASFRCLDAALTISAALNSKSPFITPFGLEDEANRAKSKFKLAHSDFLTIHNAFQSWRRASSDSTFVRKFCRQNFLSHQNLQQIEELRQQFLTYLVDSSFIEVDKECIQELNRSRYTRGYLTRFVAVPAEYDRNDDENFALLNAALCVGLYPKLLMLQDSPARTLGNNQPIAFHPSSVNFGMRLQDFGVNYLCYFTIMQSKRLYAWEAGPVDDLAIILLCGDCEFKLLADAVIIDRKIRYRMPGRTSVAMKYLRTNLAYNLEAQFKGKALTERQQKWNDLAFRVLRKLKSEAYSVNSSILQ